MTTRFRQQTIPKGHPTGYDGETSDDYTIPPCGLKDIDRSIFDLFNSDLRLSVGKHESGITKVPVIFASGEKWAMIKNNREIRDRHGSLILPLITIVRTQVSQNPTTDIAGRGINQQTGELVIKRQLDPSDRDYQKLINRVLLPNQIDVAGRVGETIAGQPITEREIGDMLSDLDVRQGALLKTNRKKNVWEILRIPSPQFVTMTYEITFWTQYLQHMNQIIDHFLSALIVPGQHFVLNTKKGYWFVATLNNDTLTFDTNFDDQRGSERLIRTKFTMNVPGYILATDSPGAPVPVRRFVSAPEIDFSLIIPNEMGQNEQNEIPDIFLGDDDPTLSIDDRKTKRNDQRGIMYPDPATSRTKYTEIDYIDSTTGKHIKRYLRTTGTNRSTGETTYSSVSDIFLTDDLTYTTSEDD